MLQHLLTPITTTTTATVLATHRVSQPYSNYCCLQALRTPHDSQIFSYMLRPQPYVSHAITRRTSALMWDVINKHELSGAECLSCIHANPPSRAPTPRCFIKSEACITAKLQCANSTHMVDCEASFKRGPVYVERIPRPEASQCPSLRWRRAGDGPWVSIDVMKQGA